MGDRSAVEPQPSAVASWYNSGAYRTRRTAGRDWHRRTPGTARPGCTTTIRARCFRDERSRIGRCTPAKSIPAALSQRCQPWAHRLAAWPLLKRPGHAQALGPTAVPPLSAQPDSDMKVNPASVPVEPSAIGWHGRPPYRHGPLGSQAFGAAL